MYLLAKAHGKCPVVVVNKVVNISETGARILAG